MSPVGQIDGKIEAEGELYLSKEFWKRLEETFSESPIFDDLEKILQEPEPLDWYSIREFPLDAARNDEMIMGFPEQGGDIILVISYTGKAEIKFDNVNSDSFDLEVYSKIRHTYTDIYLTNTAQPGDTIKILFGRGDWEITDTITEIGLSGTISNDYLDPITDPLKIGQIIRNSHIIPHADIACEKILISGATRLDQWRSADDYTYMDPGRILLHAAATLSDWRHPTDLTLINGGQIFTHSIEANKLSILTHILTGAIWTNNSPALNWVAWTDAQITYNGHTYDIADGNTNQAYIWWDFSLSTTTFQTANVKPALTDDDCIVCYNNAGTHELIWNATLIDGRTIRTGSITTDEIMANTILAGNIAANTITANEILGNTITANEILGNTITAAEIAALTITGAEIFGNTITAGKLNITDLVDIANLLTVAAGRIVIGADALGAGLDGILINDGAIDRMEIGEVAPGIYATNIRDSTGALTTSLGAHQCIWKRLYSTDILGVVPSFDVLGLHGDTEIEYLIIARWRGALATGFGIRPNNDGGNNYGFRTIVGSGNGAGANAMTWLNINYNNLWLGQVDNANEYSQGIIRLHATSGHIRTACGWMTRAVVNKTITHAYTVYTVWNNTANEITSLRFYSHNPNGIGIGSHVEVWGRPT